MRPTSSRHIAVISLLAASSLSAQASASNTWSGSIKTRDGTSLVEYRIPSGRTVASFEIVPVGATSTKGRGSATNVEFVGTSVRFRATFGADAGCKVDAVPANGYKGTCLLATGDSIELTLVPPMPSMLLAPHEILVALDAAPPALREATSVFVLEPTGYTELVHGTSGFSCFIEHPTKNDAWPMCANREAGDALLPVEQYRVRLRASGASDSAITDSILRGYRSGRFRPPPTGALAYMLSRSAWTRDPETGMQAFLTPHVHIYAPNVTNASLGVYTARRLVVPMRVEREGRPDASIIVAVKLIDPAAPRR